MLDDGVCGGRGRRGGGRRRTWHRCALLILFGFVSFRLLVFFHGGGGGHHHPRRRGTFPFELSRSRFFYGTAAAYWCDGWVQSGCRGRTILHAVKIIYLLCALLFLVQPFTAYMFCFKQISLKDVSFICVYIIRKGEVVGYHLMIFSSTEDTHASFVSFKVVKIT